MRGTARRHGSSVFALLRSGGRFSRALTLRVHVSLGGEVHAHLVTVLSSLPFSRKKSNGPEFSLLLGVNSFVYQFASLLASERARARKQAKAGCLLFSLVCRGQFYTRGIYIYAKSPDDHLSSRAVPYALHDLHSSLSLSRSPSVEVLGFARGPGTTPRPLKSAEISQRPTTKYSLNTIKHPDN